MQTPRIRHRAVVVLESQAYPSCTVQLHDRDIDQVIGIDHHICEVLRRRSGPPEGRVKTTLALGTLLPKVAGVLQSPVP